MITNGKQLRQAYLEFFKNISTHPHPIIDSAPIVPPDDPSLMFTSAGMVQFKALYSGAVDPLPYVRAASCQKCLRAGGKGSDLENVGRTLRHHTFFEMLGNFSFGDYFKRETVRWAWQFVTEVMNLPKDRLFPTIFEEDDEAEAIWREETDCVYTPVRLGAKENFWGPAGETGACGPCSELCIFLGSDEELADIKAQYARSKEDTLKVLAERIEEEGDLFLEIWNMVFPQFDQQRDGTRLPLKNRGIDTGAGLERMTVALKFARTGKPSTPYESDLMWPIVETTSHLLGLSYMTVVDQQESIAHQLNQIEKDIPLSIKDTIDSNFPHWKEAFSYIREKEILKLIDHFLPTHEHSNWLQKLIKLHFTEKSYFLDRLAINAIADHTRALVFCLAEGITPGNVGRSYVIRRIQRRALTFAIRSGMNKPFMAELYDSVVEAMGESHPEITRNPDFIRKALRREEETFLRTRDRGLRLFNELATAAKERGDNLVPGPDAFKLWDTYGFPVDMTVELAEEEGLTVDLDGYRAAMEEHKDEARRAFKGAKMDFEIDLLDELHEHNGSTEFVGYDTTGPIESEVLGFIHKGSFSETMQEGEEGLVVLRATPFYAESGGQTGDAGTIKCDTGVFQVNDCQKTPHGIYIHRGKMAEGNLSAGTHVIAQVDAARREAVKRNHSSVHLLQSALKRLVGDHITQAGSFVGPNYSRFDFTHGEALTNEQLLEIQREVNRMVIEKTPVLTEVLNLEEAKKKGAIAPFGEKYGAVVRVVSMGESSIEFCGGTHVENTAEIMHYRIQSESSVAAGIRRIEAVTGIEAEEEELDEHFHVVVPLQSTLAAKGAEVLDRVSQMQTRIKELERELAQVKQQLALKDIDKHLESLQDLNGGLKLCAARMDGLGGNDLRTVVTTLRDRIGANGVAVVVSADNGKIGIAAASGQDALKQYPAGQVLNKIAGPLGGKGGGKPDLAQGGAKDVEKIDEVIAKAAELLG